MKNIKIWNYGFSKTKNYYNDFISTKISIRDRNKELVTESFCKLLLDILKKHDKSEQNTFMNMYKKLKFTSGVYELKDEDLLDWYNDLRKSDTYPAEWAQLSEMVKHRFAKDQQITLVVKFIETLNTDDDYLFYDNLIIFPSSMVFAMDYFKEAVFCYHTGQFHAVISTISIIAEYLCKVLLIVIIKGDNMDQTKKTQVISKIEEDTKKMIASKSNNGNVSSNANNRSNCNGTCKLIFLNNVPENVLKGILDNVSNAEVSSLWKGLGYIKHNKRINLIKDSIGEIMKKTVFDDNTIEKIKTHLELSKDVDIASLMHSVNDKRNKYLHDDKYELLSEQMEYDSKVKEKVKEDALLVIKLTLIITMSIYPFLLRFENIIKNNLNKAP